jgi:chromosome partitioning protein
MIVVAVASQKGGSGKTTLSGHLAVEAEKAGAGPVALIDTDPQGSLSHWWNARTARTPQFAKVGAFELESALAHLGRTGTRLAIIDTPPAISASIAQVIAHCDLDPAEPARSACGGSDRRYGRALRQAADLRGQRRNPARAHHR